MTCVHLFSPFRLLPAMTCVEDGRWSHSVAQGSRPRDDGSTTRAGRRDGLAAKTEETALITSRGTTK